MQVHSSRSTLPWKIDTYGTASAVSLSIFIIAVMKFFIMH